MGFIQLNDPVAQHQRFVRTDHISAFELKKQEQIVTLLMIGGQELTLTRDESKQFIAHTKGHVSPGQA